MALRITMEPRFLFSFRLARKIPALKKGGVLEACAMGGVQAG